MVSSTNAIDDPLFFGSSSSSSSPFPSLSLFHSPAPHPLQFPAPPNPPPPLLLPCSSSKKRSRASAEDDDAVHESDDDSRLSHEYSDLQALISVEHPSSLINSIAHNESSPEMKHQPAASLGRLFTANNNSWNSVYFGFHDRCPEFDDVFDSILICEGGASTEDADGLGFVEARSDGEGGYGAAATGADLGHQSRGFNSGVMVVKGACQSVAEAESEEEEDVDEDNDDDDDEEEEQEEEDEEEEDGGGDGDEREDKQNKQSKFAECCEEQVMCNGEYEVRRMHGGYGALLQEQINGATGGDAAAVLSMACIPAAASRAPILTWAGLTLMDIESALAKTTSCSTACNSSATSTNNLSKIHATSGNNSSTNPNQSKISATSANPNPSNTASSAQSAFHSRQKSTLNAPIQEHERLLNQFPRDAKTLLCSGHDLLLNATEKQPQLHSSQDGSWRLKLQKRNQQEPKYTVQVETEEEALDDGYRWRKYGQKNIKNSRFPRSYYKCSSANCNAKKQVERCQEDGLLLQVTYEGIHLHYRPNPMPKSVMSSDRVRKDEKINNELSPNLSGELDTSSLLFESSTLPSTSSTTLVMHH